MLDRGIREQTRQSEVNLSIDSRLWCQVINAASSELLLSSSASLPLEN